ncbi:histone-fold-containing protein [Rhizopus microsporus ATCC 52813]|uniref:Histone-fold-containing protein n=1 Tax=Rhizopus microsporus ATCC 52813 TaxID=1340429 RepID=A0A2G4SQI1_RHIZD|nr:histone-fold-containing protein [Rhizopus microsporus ATCC 52813]PHZ11023.1 histone-fold-containing protein [Rhizopus microsporus ATCC 52813]
MAQQTTDHYSSVPDQQQQVSTAFANAVATLGSAPATAAPVGPGINTINNNPAFDLRKFWKEQMQLVDSYSSDFKSHPLPLARIKKVMKTDPEVKMISAEAPILFAKGCEIFITEITKRAWIHAEENKRRTLQRSDIATAISKTDMCDFLIDIVPREEALKAATAAPFEQPEYTNYYAQGTAVPPYTAQQAMDPAVAYYPTLTPEQMQQYQYQLQQFAVQQQQQQQQASSSPPSFQPSENEQNGSKSSSPGGKVE